MIKLSFMLSLKKILEIISLKHFFFFAIISIVSILLILEFRFFLQSKEQQSIIANLQKATPLAEPQKIQTTHEIRSQSTFSETLNKAGIKKETIHDIVQAFKSVKDLSKVKAGTKIHIYWTNDLYEKVLEIELVMSHHQSIIATLHDQTWNVKIVDLPIDNKLVSFQGFVENSLWDSAKKSGMDANLVMELAEIFAWQIDFNREIRPGDRWRLIVERKFVQNKSIGWGNIVAAQYQNQGQLFSAVRYELESKRFAYFDLEGESLRKMFLKSPIRFARITSRFQSARFHPILGTARAHNGVDYGASPGTPVRSVGDGVVSFVGRNGFHGNMIKIKHNSIYATSYSHLKGFAKDMGKGKRLEQGEVIGYVGQTGLATGPHLHFAFYEYDVYVDPLGRKFPSADPVPKSKLQDYQDFSSRKISLLPRWGQITQQGWAQHFGVEELQKINY